MVLEGTSFRCRHSHWRGKAARALGDFRVAAVDIFTDIGGDPEVMRVIEVNSNSVDPAAGAIRPKRSDPENLAS